MSKASKPTNLEISKVHDAIAVLKSRGVPVYRTDIRDYTGMTLARVDRVLEYDEAVAASKPKGKTTVRWTRQAGQTSDGGIAVSERDRDIAALQRDKAITTQLIRHASRRRTEYLRKSADSVKAIAWARAARRIDVSEFPPVRAEIDQVHMDAMRDLVASGGLAFDDAWNKHHDLMAEIDAL